MAKFTFEQTGLDGCVVITPMVFADDRGYFMETYQQEEFAQAGIAANFVQDNQSKSTKGVLRGLHFQKQHPQGKLVRVISGMVFDVAVDLRSKSKSFGKWFGVELSAENGKQFFVPEGFAHGFLVLSSTAEFVYKCTDYYTPGDEGSLLYNDETINIQWPTIDTDIILSEKDKQALTFKNQTFEYFDRW